MHDAGLDPADDRRGRACREFDQALTTHALDISTEALPKTLRMGLRRKAAYLLG